uniref:PH domain-containing protein n=1 Tax=Eutreptiella gymnastica TaxID=73025 RepID=A0A7S4CYL8_9EUGL|mmetsp:Transcript_34274/g.56262  ORF Transcript_34274/g.56262 Transcript_34274/m.56262 type:complete len:827 (-) Transcript_34274:123-2603(-)
MPRPKRGKERDGACLRGGLLKKVFSGGGDWQTGYYELYQDRLLYYRPHKVIDLGNVSLIPSRSAPLVFTVLNVLDRSSTIFRTPTETGRIDWLECIAHIIRRSYQGASSDSIFLDEIEDCGECIKEGMLQRYSRGQSESWRNCYLRLYPNNKGLLQTFEHADTLSMANITAQPHATHTCRFVLLGPHVMEPYTLECSSVQGREQWLKVLRSLEAVKADGPPQPNAVRPMCNGDSVPRADCHSDSRAAHSCTLPSPKGPTAYWPSKGYEGSLYTGAETTPVTGDGSPGRVVHSYTLPSQSPSKLTAPSKPIEPPEAVPIKRRHSIVRAAHSFTIPPSRGQVTYLPPCSQGSALPTKPAEAPLAGEGMPVTVSHGAARAVHSYTIPSSSGASYLPTRSTVEASLPKVADNPVTGNAGTGSWSTSMAYTSQLRRNSPATSLWTPLLEKNFETSTPISQPSSLQAAKPTPLTSDSLRQLDTPSYTDLKPAQPDALEMPPVMSLPTPEESRTDHVPPVQAPVPWRSSFNDMYTSAAAGLGSIRSPPRSRSATPPRGSDVQAMSQVTYAPLSETPRNVSMGSAPVSASSSFSSLPASMLSLAQSSFTDTSLPSEYSYSAPTLPERMHEYTVPDVQTSTSYAGMSWAPTEKVKGPADDISPQDPPVAQNVATPMQYTTQAPQPLLRNSTPTRSTYPIQQPSPPPSPGPTAAASPAPTQYQPPARTSVPLPYGVPASVASYPYPGLQQTVRYGQSTQPTLAVPTYSGAAPPATVFAATSQATSGYSTLAQGYTPLPRRQSDNMYPGYQTGYQYNSSMLQYKMAGNPYNIRSPAR